MQSICYRSSSAYTRGCPPHHVRFTCLTFALACLLISSTAFAKDSHLSEATAVQMIKDLPEYKAHSGKYQCAFSDYEPMEDSRGYGRAASFTHTNAVACRLDVNTVSDDRLIDSLILWQRFMISSTGEMFVWDKLTGAYLTLDQWRTAGNW